MALLCRHRLSATGGQKERIGASGRDDELYGARDQAVHYCAADDGIGEDREIVELKTALQVALATERQRLTALGLSLLVVTKGDKKAMLPFSKNLPLVNGKTIELEGIVVFAEKLGKVYVPRQAAEIVKAEFK